MATMDDYKAVRDALVVVLRADIKQFVPGWAQGMIPANEADVLAQQLSTLAVDTLDNHRKTAVTK